MSHLNFVDRVVHFLAPHRDAVLTVGAGPAVLAETLRLEAGERPVVRDTHGTLSRHGRGSRTPRHGMGRRGGTHSVGPAGPRDTRTDRGHTSADAAAVARRCFPPILA